MKHQRSERHKRSVRNILHQVGLVDAEGILPAPPAEEFAMLLTRIRKGELESTCRGDRQKQTTMSWCLFEAQREKERNFLANAVCLSVAQDASIRGPLLLTRYVACGPSLERVSGILRVADAQRISGAEDLANSVFKGFRDMATARRPHPTMMQPARPAKRLKTLEAHLASITEVFVADGAADEQLAGRMLHGARAASDGKRLPNLRLVARDKPHSARRLLQRTLPCDPFIRRLMSALLWSRRSLTRLVQHSAHWREKFRQLQLRFSDGPVIKDMQYSKQRFDSTARPLGRMIDHFDAFLAIAAAVMNERTPCTDEHQSANNALAILDTENMLQLGMVADACDAVVRFIRFLDNEKFDTAELQCQINALTTTVAELFHGRACLTYAGFTTKMVALIRRPRLVMLSGGKPKTLGDERGPSEAIVARCLGRMVNWWRLASSVLETEFPDWDLLLRFHAFRVPRDLTIRTQTRDQLQGLCANFNCDPSRVLAEYEDLCPVASQFAGQIAATGASEVSWQAWQRTVQHMGKKAWNNSELRKLLFRYVAYVGSSSGVEQTFSQCLAQFRHLRNFSIPGVQRILVLAGTRGQPHSEDLALYARARLIWAENFGAPRRGAPKMFSAVRLGKLAADKMSGHSEAAARRGRALALADLQTKGGRQTNAAIATSRLWGSRQQKELERQKRMQAERKMDAALMGLVEVEPATLGAYRAKQLANHQRYQQRLQTIRKNGLPTDLRLNPGTPTWVADDDWNELMQNTFLGCRLLRELRLGVALAFVVRDVATPPRMVDLAASLVGGIVASVAHMARPPGPLLRYGRALSQKRALWISPGVQAQAPKTIELIRTAVRHAAATADGTSWKLICQEEFSRLVARGRPDRRRQQWLVALATAAERERLPRNRQPYCQVLSKFAAGCKRIER